MKVLIIQTSLNSTSISVAMSEAAGAFLKSLGVSVEFVLQGDFAKVPVYGLEFEDSGVQASLLQKVVEADAILWSIPIYCAGVSGGAKNLFDHFSGAFVGKWFAILAAAGSERSMYAVNSFMLELAIESCAPFVPFLALATDSDITSDRVLTHQTNVRIENVCRTLVNASQKLPRLEQLN